MGEIKIDWLPMGSVVKLSQVETPVVIVGRMQREPGEGRAWEYAGSPYPCGFEDSSNAVLFDGDRIDHVLFLGYRSDAELAFCRELTKAREGLQDSSPREGDADVHRP